MNEWTEEMMEGREALLSCPPRGRISTRTMKNFKRFPSALNPFRSALKPWVGCLHLLSTLDSEQLQWFKLHFHNMKLNSWYKQEVLFFMGRWMLLSCSYRKPSELNGGKGNILINTDSYSLYLSTKSSPNDSSAQILLPSTPTFKWKLKRKKNRGS